MEKLLKVNGTINQIQEVFKNSNLLSIRHYKVLTKETIKDDNLNKKLKFEVNVRFADDLENEVLKVKKISDLLILNDGLITKNNIHLYYEFMSDEDLLKYKDITSIVFSMRFKQVVSYFKKINFLIEKNNGFDYSLLHYSHKLVVENTVNYYLSISFFEVKDTLKSIGEYISDIKESAAYKNHTLLSTIKKRVKLCMITY